MNWLLLVIVLIVGACAFAGWRVGFVKTVFSLISTIAVIIITLIFSPVVTKILVNNEKIYQGVYEKIDLVINLSEEDKEGSAESFIDGLAVPEVIKASLKNNEDISRQSTAMMGEFEAYVCQLITEVILKAIGFIVTFIVAAAALAIACFLLDVISKLPVLHQINTLAGAAGGALEGLIIVWIFFIVITMFGSSEFGQKTLAMISESQILSFLYDHNILSGGIF